ncbi:hypothetical protein BpJC7_03480 [Weizmannia acidilactici]|uniref:Magnesium transporter MgtE intracellular domain-containing protein n=1 Tax=Weizmannia acidilactici TaxID=2607726 RepID=A0A5J4JEP4_9BACI|nr:MotE family protein [Weizmannia acidilactici]GER65625.1 hypothetical protein BpJC4_00960 [Weizmannia acidilactici]GER69045.1 hypothetical protein BpJC7_03480 [Weizmannia acidilactici]
MGKKQEEIEAIDEKKSGSKLQWFFYVVLIPLLFAIAVGLIVATFSGVNVISEAAGIGHKVAGIFGSGEDKQNQNQGGTYSAKQYVGQIDSLKKQMEQKDKEISKLQSELDKSQQNNLKMKQTVLDLQSQLKKAQQTQAANKKKLKEIASTYENMNPDNAAAIIEKMSDTEATQILSQLSSETLAGVLEKMSASKAAKYTQLLSQKGS